MRIDDYSQGYSCGYCDGLDDGRKSAAGQGLIYCLISAAAGAALVAMVMSL